MTVGRGQQKRGYVLQRDARWRAPRPEDSRRIATIVWWAMLGSLPVYARVVYFVHVGRLGELASALLLPLCIGAGLDFLLSFPLPGRVERQTVRRLSQGAREGHSQSEQDLRAALHQGAMVTVIVMGALGASIAIYGLVLGVLGAPLRICLPFFVVPLLHMIWQKTKQEHYFQRADERVREILAGYFAGES